MRLKLNLRRIYYFVTYKNNILQDLESTFSSSKVLIVAKPLINLSTI